MTVTLTASQTLTAALARMLAAQALPPAAILLDGPVGAGKTHFARAFIRARQGQAAEDVPSPTYTLVQTYDDPMGTEIWHADLYRLTDPAELAELGLEDALDHAICLIEWPDRLAARPPGAILLSLMDHADPDLRRIVLDMPDAARLAARAVFVHDAGWDEARVTPLAGDASARRYFRLEGSGGAVLMDDPSGSVPAFAAMTGWLRDHGFGAPRIMAADPDAGFLLLEDLGDDLVACVLADRPDLAPRIQDRITDLLVALQAAPPPAGLAVLDGPAMGDLAALFTRTYPGADLPDLPALIADLHDCLCAGVAPVLSLRDYHAENLIWRGEDPIGLLDYQDAVLAHPAYDPVSAWQDARRDIDPGVEAAQIRRFLDATGHEDAAFRAAYALIGAQRALRILGVFARLAIRDGKPRYLDFMPRVWGNLQRNLAHPALAPLRAALQDVPSPRDGAIERIRAACRP